MSFIISTPVDSQGSNVAGVMTQRTVVAWVAASDLRAMLNVDERFAPINFDRE